MLSKKDLTSTVFEPDHSVSRDMSNKVVTCAAVGEFGYPVVAYRGDRVDISRMKTVPSLWFKMRTFVAGMNSFNGCLVSQLFKVLKHSPRFFESTTIEHKVPVCFESHSKARQTSSSTVHMCLTPPITPPRTSVQSIFESSSSSSKPQTATFSPV